MSDENNLQSLVKYNSLDDPLLAIIYPSIVLLLLSSLVYSIFGFLIPHNPDFWYPLASIMTDSKASYLAWVDSQLSVAEHEKWNRLMLIAYLSMYTGMWMAYFRSKKYPDDDPREQHSLKIQSLRRLLGHNAHQWQLHTDSTKEDDEVIKTFRRKGETGMNVIAILIAVSILIFDQISNIWMTDREFSLWQYSILWVGMLSAMLSFICFMMCVDALDTIFNRFTNDSTRNVLIKFFYGYTLNPRYAGGAAMLLSIVLLLGFHSELLGSLAVIAMLLIGYNLWFPDVSSQLNSVAGIDYPSQRKCWKWYGSLLLLPLIVRAIVFFVHA